MKTLKEFSELIIQYRDVPSELDNINLEMAAKFGMMTELFKDLQLEKAKFTTEKKFEGDKPLSDSAVNALWLMEEGGKKEIKMRYELKALEKMMSAIRSSITVSQQEARNFI